MPLSLWTSEVDWSAALGGAGLGPMRRPLATLVVTLFALLLRRVVLRALDRSVEEVARRYQVGKVATYAIGVVTAVLLLQIWLSDSEGIGTWLGIASAGLAIALRDPIVNLAGWVFILVRQPFGVGDRIQIGDIAGDVVDVGPLTFSLLEIGNWVRDDQSTGRIIHLPNGRVFHEPVASYTQGFEYIWNELNVVVTFESDWQRARDLLQAIAERSAAAVADEAREQIRRSAHKYMIHYKHLTPITWVAVVDIGVSLSVRYLCRARARRSSAHALWAEILTAFHDEPRIDFAYPTTRMFRNHLEGKPELRGEANVGGAEEHA